jgi:type II secretory pathway component PulF
MNYDEFAFFNQQLAAMLQEGIPLEGALKQLCEGMRSGKLRTELEQLQTDLSRGTPLKEAMAPRNLPPLYARMLEVGARSNDLPGILTLLADHYHRVNALWTRLKGLMVYPLLVVLVSLALTVMLAIVFGRFLSGSIQGFGSTPVPNIAFWPAPMVFLIAAAFGVTAIAQPRLRARLRWRLPAFREASLAQLASALALMLRKGVPLPEALALAEALESNTAAAKTIGGWRELVESGHGKPGQWPVARPFPPLFLWLVRTGGEDVAAGFEKAAEIYQGRAAYRTELLLYGALPVSILLLGQLVFWQAAPLFRTLAWFMNMLGDMGGS